MEPSQYYQAGETWGKPDVDVVETLESLGPARKSFISFVDIATLEPAVFDIEVPLLCYAEQNLGG